MDLYKLVVEIQMIRIANTAAKYNGLQMGLSLESCNCSVGSNIPDASIPYVCVMYSLCNLNDVPMAWLSSVDVKLLHSYT